MSGEIAVKVDNLTKIYKLYDSTLDRLKESMNPFGRKYHRDYYALNDVSIEIMKGETVGIIGMNGSGKSTLLKTITGVLTPSSGNVTVNGKISALLELGAGFNPELTGLENVYFNGTLMGFSREEIGEKLDDILSFADIGEFVYQPVKMYSSGMFVRLAFAVAINVDPDILIVDEALSVGDIKFQRKCFARIEKFREDKKTILLVSHGLDTVNMLCNYAYLLSSGRVIEQGMPKNVTRIFQMIMLGQEIKNDRIDNVLGKELPGASDQILEVDENNIEFIKDMAELKGTVEEKLKNWDGRKKAEIIDCGILDSLGSRTTILETGAYYSFFTTVLTYVDIPKLHVGYPITNTQGLFLFSTNSDIQNVDIKPQKKGNVVEGRVDLRMWLAPGDYFLTFRAANKEEDFDELPDRIHFVVVGEGVALRRSIVNLQPKVTVKNIIFNTNDEPSNESSLPRG